MGKLARPSLASEHGTHGGAVVLSKNQLQISSHAPGTAGDHIKLIGDEIVLSVLQLRKGAVMLGAVYLDDKIGPTHPRNHIKLAAIAKLALAASVPFLSFGDWNCEPQELCESGFVNASGASIMTADTPLTCTIGSGRLLDYLVLCDRARALVQTFDVDLQANWKPHLGFRLHIHTRPAEIKVRMLTSWPTLSIHTDTSDAK